jgi:uncharacterized membrane protein YccC
MEPSHVVSPPAPQTSRKHVRWQKLCTHFTYCLKRSLPNPAIKSDLEAVLFSLKCFLAAMAALFISLRIGLPRPVGAIGTVYLISQPFSGMSVSRGLFRLVGTVVGGGATVFLVSTFDNEPLVLSMVLAAWVGFCLYLARLDRTPRAYAFQLAGYTTSLIGFPSVMDPGGIFDVASLRLQEIVIGILCATLVHTLILPRRVFDRVQVRVAGILCDSERWTRHMLGAARGTVLARDRARAAADMLDLHQLSTHLQFETVDGSVRSQILGVLHQRLLAVVSLSGAIDDTLMELHASPHGVPRELFSLFEQVRSWLDASKGILDPVASETLLKRLRTELTATGTATATLPGWRGLLVANLLSNLGDLVLAHQDCRLLEQRLKAARSQWMRNLPERLRQPGKVYALHRDHWLAARSGMGAAIGIMVSCVIWIGTAWPDGATALLLIGTACGLFGTADQPAGIFMRYLIGTVAGVAVGLIYGFGILPRTTSFVSLVAVLAPVLLLNGCVQARPPYTFAALGVVLTFPIIAGLGLTNASDFPDAANGAVALIIGSGMAAVSLLLFQTIGVDHSVDRLLRAIRIDVARRAAGGGTEIARWTSGMMDRVGLLVPRLAGHSQSERLLRQALADVRTGHTASELRVLEKQLQDRALRSCLVSLLDELAAYLRKRDAAGVDDLLERLDVASAALAVETSPVCRQMLAHLSDLRRDLSLRATDSEVQHDA